MLRVFEWKKLCTEMIKLPIMSSKKCFYCVANSLKSYDSEQDSKAPSNKNHHKDIYSRFFALNSTRLISLTRCNYIVKNGKRVART